MGRSFKTKTIWLRPLKLIGLANLFCGIIAFILSMSLEDWAISDESQEFKFHMSLWKQCVILPSFERPIMAPEKQDERNWKCQDATARGGYVAVVQAFIILPFIISIVSFAAGCVAYWKREWIIVYKISAIALCLGAFVVLVAVIVFPTMFLQDLPFYAFFRFWWGYGFAWAALCFMVAAAVLFFISRDKKEVYRNQKTTNI